MIKGELCSPAPSPGNARIASVVVALATLAAAGCGGEDPAEDTVRRIIEELGSRQFGSATARYQQAEELVLSPAAAPSWRRGFEHQDATVREWSVDSLARIGLPEDVPLVAGALDDPFRNVQEAAARSIVMLDEDVAMEAFIERLSSGEPLLQTIAAQGLAGLGDASATPALVARLDDPTVEDAVRGIIAQSLAILADPRAVEPLARIAGDAGAEIQLRRNAADALATFQTPAATQALEGLLDSDDAYVQEVARRAIAGRR